MPMKSPPPLGLLIREDVIALLNLSWKDTATRFGVEAKHLSAVLKGYESLIYALVANFEKVGISTAKTWTALHEAYDQEKNINQADQ